MVRVWAAAVAACLAWGAAEAKRPEEERYWTDAKARQVRQERSVLSEVARRAMPSVVSITTVQEPAPGEKEEQTGLGSGFVIHPDGYILTSAHVIEGSKEIRVTLLSDDGFTEEYLAKLVGEDRPTDFALLKIEAGHPLKALPLGRSGDVDIADWVVVIGNPFGLGHSVSVGVVSYKGRTDVTPNGMEGYFDYIQTDAAINPGNSGGPMLDLNGHVVAIANAVNVSGQGIAFAIPIEVAKTIIPSLMTEGRVRRGWVGISIEDLTPERALQWGIPTRRGVLVSEVQEDSPAAQAGLRPGDLIVGVDDVRTLRSQALRWRVSNKGVGRKVKLEVERQGKPLRLEVTLVEKPQLTAELGVGGAGPAGTEPTRLEIGALVTQVTETEAHLAGLSHPFGALVTDVDPKGVGHAAGLAKGDVVVKVNRREVDSLADLVSALEEVPSGQWVRLFVRRSAQTHALTLRKP